MDELSQADSQLAGELGVTLLEFKEAVKEGQSLEKVFHEEVNADSIYTICYTSGTTGMPKGVMLSHRNYIANLGAFEGFDGQFRLYPTDVYISYLPLAHVLERMLMLLCMAEGVQYGFYGGDVLKLKEDLQVLKPTIMVSVPRLFTRFYDVMQQKINELTGMKKTITSWGV
jgi:long-chain acyl-CoA synthetase